MKDFTQRTVALEEESKAELLKQQVYEPILRTCALLGRNPSARVSVANLLGDAIACRGDIRSMIALATFVRRLLAEEAGAGLEAGVFVTWGREAGVVDVGDPDVGAWRVVVAEQLTVAARGAAQSAGVVRDRAQRRAASERDAGRTFDDPFSVHTSADPNELSATTDFHNGGAAITGEALAAYEAASVDLVFRRLSVPPSTLPGRMGKYWLTRPLEELVLATDAGGAPALLLRFCGRTIFRGREANGPTDVWELILVSHGFGRDFVEALAAVEQRPPEH
jgi:hypothetical protein